MSQPNAVLRWPLACLAVCCVSLISSSHLYGQAGLRESLERLDKNENGEIDPHEVTALARPYLERITRERRMSLDRSNEIEDLQEAARIYHSLKNGVSGRDVRPAGESTVKPFGTDRDQPIVPEFGLAEVKYPYTQDDLDFADRTLRSHDDNDDGYISRAEAAHEKWTHRNPFDDDLNKDDRLSRLEMAQRYARRRLLDQMSDELRQKNRRTGGEIRSSSREDQGRRDDSQWYRRGGNSYWLTASMLGRFDLNKNGRLESQETQSLGMPVAEIDVDRDSELSREELHAFLSQLQDQAGNLAEGIPGWFYELDQNRDRQVSMSEFSTDWTNEKIQEFASLDTNGDGLLTSMEVVQSKAMVGGSFNNRNAEVLPPGRTVISEIDVNEDFIVGDLNVQLSITHSNVSFLDAHLTGPDGQQIELFTEVGGGNDHFEETIFDDQSRYPITKARPPFKGTFIPEGMLKRQPSLSHFNGKSAKGVWQLVIRGTRSERFGMLHSWSLFFKPQEQMLGDSIAAPLNDGPQSGPVASSWPVQVRSESDSKASVARPESSRRSEPVPRTKIDYQAIGQRMAEAVKAGKMTEDQVRQAWISIKSRAKEQERRGEGDRGDQRRVEDYRGSKSKDEGLRKSEKDRSRYSREEAIERYRKMMDSRKREGR